MMNILLRSYLLYGGCGSVATGRSIMTITKSSKGLWTAHLDRHHVPFRGFLRVAATPSSYHADFSSPQIFKKSMKPRRVWIQTINMFNSLDHRSLNNHKDDLSFIQRDGMDFVQHYLMYQSKVTHNSFYLIFFMSLLCVMGMREFVHGINSMEELEDRFKEKNTFSFWASVFFAVALIFIYPRYTKNIMRIYYDKKAQIFILIVPKGATMKQTRKIICKPEDFIAKETFTSLTVLVKGQSYFLTRQKKADEHMMKILFRTIS
ncbi:uncharacterized protein LOC106175706 [Lingula anatina]|uniref:Uncharacterized protein LOC106175706 n=1 Tax=Lingula anatina TaxID=7574 RepID=A0A1S3JSC6_LINAN|nr:uncharacterized protein LOC106175706 [Lingula anatina]|eukprot:XP_013413285.1 uncharacterized protein LOC106175706 [Lingula anatina]